MNHIQFSIIASPAEQEVLIAQLSEVGAEGFEEYTDRLLAYFIEGSFSIEIVNELVRSYSYQQEVLAEKNWNAVWEENFTPVIVDNFCGIRAHFHEPVKGVDLEIVITPKMSFGTGHHATTYMMIEQMKGMQFQDREVFDFGTGTGILAILAKKLGAAKVTAIDVDEWSISNAAENFERNGISGINLYESSSLPQSMFEVVLANINKNVLIQFAQGLGGIIKPDGYLLISGILESDEDEICSSYSNEGLKLIKRLQSGNWLSLLFKR
ncbi:MAG TPA: 50S ribosomal protein L11 methyltransferase [Chitinophagaceae bacterium]|nr:50S ribosomal protein L11 methyltransferase [Chitinophagaceae bacterium]